MMNAFPSSDTLESGSESSFRGDESGIDSPVSVETDARANDLGVVSSGDSKGTATSATASNSLRARLHSEHVARCSCNLLRSSSDSSPVVEMAQSSRNFSCGRVRDPFPLARLFPFAAMGSTAPNLTPKHLLPQSVQAAVIMVSHIPQGLANFVADFRQRIALEKVQA